MFANRNRGSFVGSAAQSYATVDDFTKTSSSPVHNPLSLTRQGQSGSFEKGDGQPPERQITLSQTGQPRKQTVGDASTFDFESLERDAKQPSRAPLHVSQPQPSHPHNSIRTSNPQIQAPTPQTLTKTPPGHEPRATTATSITTTRTRR